MGRNFIRVAFSTNTKEKGNLTLVRLCALPPLTNLSCPSHLWVGGLDSATFKEFLEQGEQYQEMSALCLVWVVGIDD